MTIRFLLLFIYVGALNAQDIPSIRYFTLEDGLSQVTINELIKDSLGFIWIGTQDGLNRFDGKEFKTYKYNKLNATSISGNHVTSLLEDNYGDIWIGTRGNGLNRYDYDLDIFSQLPLNQSNPFTETIQDMVLDEDASIWLTTQNSGLFRISPDSKRGYVKENFLKNESLNGLLLDSNNNLWVGGNEGAIYKLNQNISIDNEPLPEFIVDGNVKAFYKVRSKLFIGTEIGLFLYNIETGELRRIDLNKTGDSPTRHVVTFLKADDESVWIGSGSGLFLLDCNLLQVIYKVQYDENDTGGLSNNTVQSLVQNAEKQLFVGTANNLNLLDFEEPYFKNISKNKKGLHLLNDNVIFSILKDKDNLWIGTSDGGLNLISKGKNYYFQENQNNPFSISGNVVREICKDEQSQRLWIATTRGLSMLDLKTFDPENPRFKVFRHIRDDLNTINNDFLKGIAVDRSGKVWGATFGHGIFSLELLDNDEPKITRYKNEKNNPNSILNNFAQCISVDNEDEIWIGSQGGLTNIRFDKSNGIQPTFINYTNTIDVENSLTHNSVYDVLIDGENNKWIATRYGLNLLLDDGTFKSWTEQEQFTSAIIYGIQDDLDGNLWLGTTEGIVYFNPKLNRFKQYDVQDGIQSNEFDIHARFRDNQGLIYLGGIDGVTYFHPRDLHGVDKPRPLFFSEFRIKDKSIVTQNSSEAILQKSLLKTEELVFNHNQFPFYLQFSSIDFRLNKKIEYGYRLLPNNQEWNMLKDPEIQFLNLPSGNHTLLVNGFSRGVEWGEEPLRINLTILAPWWSSWWAYLLYLILALYLTYFIYRFQVSRKLAVAESKRLTEINQLKSSLYTNITHEFRTPLTVILGMTDTLKEQLGDKKLQLVKTSLDMIERNGKNLLQLVNQMLDLAKLESGNMDLKLVKTDVVPFINYICESFQCYANESGINLVVYSEVNNLLMDLDEQKLQAIISNLLSNAIKFIGAGDKIIVHLNRYEIGRNELLLVKVKDNGIGISKDELPNIFNRFYQADTTHSRRGEGTGVGLSLTKKFVELMGGKITVTSDIGEGTEFVIQLPISAMATSSNTNYPEIEAPSIIINGLNEEVANTFKSSDLPIALLIEDDLDVAYFLKNTLNGKYRTLHAKNGGIGLEKAFEEIPDIIICDVMMPVMDGYKVCKTLKSDKRTDHIPIIMLTAKVTHKDRLTGLSHGADAYLTKPFEKAELFTRLTQLILLRKKLIEKFEDDDLSKFLRTRTENPGARFIKDVIHIVHKEIENPNFGPKHLAFELKLSESQTYRKVKSISGKSTALFIRSIKLQKAKVLLQTSNKTVSEIAYAVGFNDPSWFSRAFKEEFGYAPSAIHK